MYTGLVYVYIILQIISLIKKVNLMRIVFTYPTQELVLIIIV